MAETAVKPKRGPTGPLYIWAKEPIGRGLFYGGRKMSKGQVLTLGQLPNDARLLELGYVQKLAKGAEVTQCLRCGEWFVDADTLHLHQQERCPMVSVEMPEGVLPAEDDDEEETS